MPAGSSAVVPAETAGGTVGLPAETAGWPAEVPAGRPAAYTAEVPAGTRHGPWNPTQTRWGSSAAAICQAWTATVWNTAE